MRSRDLRWRYHERGQGSVEYLALAAIVATCLVVGVALNGQLAAAVKNSVDGGMRQGACILLGGPNCEKGGEGSTPDPSESEPSIPPYQDPSKTPLEQATWGDYVALGDSYSSGEGGSQYDGDTNHPKHYCTTTPDGYPDCKEREDFNVCHRSTEAYGQRVSREVKFKGDYKFAACSGAVTDDFYDKKGSTNKPQHGEKKQLDNVNANTSLITLSVGGNDANFGTVIENCVKAGLNPTSHCKDDAEQIRKDIDAIRDDVAALLREARKKAPNARIVVVGYPRLFPEPPKGGNDDTVIDPEDQAFLNGESRHINQVIKGAVDDVGGANNGVEFVDPYDAFDGCEIGTDNSCMNDIKLGDRNGKPPIDAGSFHPNDRGHERLSELVEKQIREGQ